MKRQVKKEESTIITNNFEYPKHTTEIQKALLVEQHSLCAYTETYLGRTDKKEIEHFNPTLKNTEQDGYENWFLVKGQWNNEKGSVPRWNKHQPLILPTNKDFGERIIYFDGDYICKPADKEADNLIKFLKLDDEDLAKERKLYVARRKDAIKKRGVDAQSYFDEKLKNEPNSVYFIRAIEEEFGIKLAL
jgi:hypothetical protein